MGAPFCFNREALFRDGYNIGNDWLKSETDNLKSGSDDLNRFEGCDFVGHIVNRNVIVEK